MISGSGEPRYATVNPRISSLPFRAAGAHLFLLLLFSSCSLHGTEVSGHPSGAVAVVVRAAFRDAPLAGVRVEFLRSPGESGEAPVAAGVTDRKGLAAFDLPPGRYFLVARWAKDGDPARPVAPGDRFGYFGGNPVFVAAGGTREIFLGVEEVLPPPAVPGPAVGTTGVAGVVLVDGAPAPDAHVFAYLKSEGGFRDTGFAASSPTDADGGFVLELPPGKYFLLARKRAGGFVAGPLRKGDLFGYAPGNPVTIADGTVLRIAIPATLLKLRNAPAWSAGYPAAASIEGRIVDQAGNPVRGVYAALYDNPDLLNRPVFLSDVSGADGKYHLPVPVPGRYYLAARSGYGGPPAPGDLYGRYEGNPEHVVTLREGDHRTGIDVTVDALFPGR